MNLTYSDLRETHLRRKLELYLGTGNDWIFSYREWCVENKVEDGQVYDEHNILVFVKQQRKQHASRKINRR